MISFYFNSATTLSWQADEDGIVTGVSCSTPQGVLVSLDPDFSFAEFGTRFGSDQVLTDFLLLATGTTGIYQPIANLDFQVSKDQKMFITSGVSGAFAQIFFEPTVQTI